jgi:hypothetical protein
MALEKKADEISGTRGRLLRFSDFALGAPLTVDTEQIGAAWRVDAVGVYYSVASTVDVEIYLVSGVVGGPVPLRTISLSAEQSGAWIPEEEILFSSDDGLEVVAPLGGVGVDVGILVYLVEVGR